MARAKKQKFQLKEEKGAWLKWQEDEEVVVEEVH